VGPCWYRAFIDNRPKGFVIQSPEDLDALCQRLAGLQRQACITAASVIGPPDPALQLQICAGLGDRADAAACVRGTKVHSVLTDGAFGRAGCPRLAPTARRDCRAGASRMNDALVTFS
jgi:hypothetical protein